MAKFVPARILVDATVILVSSLLICAGGNHLINDYFSIVYRRTTSISVERTLVSTGHRIMGCPMRSQHVPDRLGASAILFGLYHSDLWCDFTEILIASRLSVICYLLFTCFSN